MTNKQPPSLEYQTGFADGLRAARERNTSSLFGRHASEYFTLKCMPDLAASGIYPNLKEVTESAAAFYAVRNHLRDEVRLNDPRVTLVAVGDGSTPRTSAMFAYRTAWHCIGIDPKMQEREWHGAGKRPVSRLTTIRSKVEDLSLSFAGPLVVAAVHSHAPMQATLAALRARHVHVVAIPCCMLDAQMISGLKPDATYDDHHCWSAKRTVHVWRNVPS